MDIISIIIVLNALAFLFYGLQCLFSPKMIKEFDRFGLPSQRIITGILQLLGAAGLIVGQLVYPLIGVLAAAGLTLLMLLGFGVRIRNKDNFAVSFPSFFFVLVNASISYAFYTML